METALTVTTGGALNADIIGGVVTEYLSNLDVGAQSRKTYAHGVYKFLDWARLRNTGAPTRADIIAYRDELTGTGADGKRRHTPATVATYMVGIRSFYAFLSTSTGAPNVATGIKSPKQAKGHKKDALTAAQARAILTAIPRDTAEGRRDYALIKLLLTTGLRTIEAARADIGDIRTQGGKVVLWVQGKGRAEKDDFVVLPPDVESAIRAYLRTRADAQTAPLFVSHSDRHPNGRLLPQSISRIVKTRLRAAGYNDNRLTAHSLRHTAVTLSLLAGATIQDAQQMARHSNINTTLIYAHNLNRISNAPEEKISMLLNAA